MKDVIFQPRPSRVPIEQRIFDVLDAPECPRPPVVPIEDSADVLQICRWVLEMRIKGRSNETLNSTLTERLELSSEEAGRLILLAETAGSLAVETTERQSDPSDAVDRLAEQGVDQDFAIDLINSCIHLFHHIVDESGRGRDGALGVDLKSAQAYFAAADYVLDCLEAGRSEGEAAATLVEKEIFPPESAAGFVDEVLLARTAGRRIAEGEDGTAVFEELGLQDRSPYVMLLALRLKEARD